MIDYIKDIFNRRTLFYGTPRKLLFTNVHNDKEALYSGRIEGLKVLDLGCGNYSLPFCLRSKTKIYDTYDIDKSNLLAKYHDLNDIKDKYDLIIASHVFEHFDTYEMVYKDLNWCYEHCDNMIISVPNHSSLYDSMKTDFTHNLILNTFDFICILDKAGFITELILLSNLTFGETIIQHLRYLVRAAIVFLLVESPFYHYTLICRKKKIVMD